MNLQEALNVHDAFKSLALEIGKRVPQTLVVEGESYMGGGTYQLEEVDCEHLIARYRMYIGCGDYERAARDIDLEQLFGEEV